MAVGGATQGAAQGAAQGPAQGAAQGPARGAAPRVPAPLSAWDAGAEVALAAVTLAALWSLGRLFTDVSVLVPAWGVAVAVHTTGALIRRRRWPPGVTVLSGVAVVTGVAVWGSHPETTWVGLPTSATVDALRADLAGAWTAFQEARPPVEPLTGFVLVLVAAAAAVAVLADWAGLRLGLTAEAVVPAAAVFVFGGVLARNTAPVTTTVLFASVTLVFVLVHRTAKAAAAPGWVGSARRKGPPALVVTGLSVAAAAVGLGAVVGPRLPGASASPIVNLRDLGDGGGGQRVTISPLVDIRGRLVEQSPLELFTVRADRPAYWRLTALGTFDGHIWSAAGRYRGADGELGTDQLTGDAPRTTVVQDIAVSRLDMLWLPAAFPVVDLVAANVEVGFEPVTATLITEEPTAIGAVYTVLSEQPLLDAGRLAGAGGPVPAELDPFLELPADLPPEIADLARTVTAGATTPYEQALALQRFFREGFTYTLDVPAGHSGDAVLRFLFETRAGYCEQFAGSFAAMARTLGLPSRVAVGFTPGELGADGLYHVRGEHAHAWPEVWIAGVGWVPFEPTPGRGAPGAEAYTGVPAQQAAPGAPTESEPVPEVTPSTAPPTATVPPPTVAPEPSVPDLVDTAEGSDVADAPPPAGAGRSWLPVIATLAVVVAALGAVPLAGAVLAVWHDRRARTPLERTRWSWHRTTVALTRAGVPPVRSETAEEYAGRCVAVLDVPAGPIRHLAETTTRATFAPEGVDAATAASAEEAATTVRRRVLGAMGPVRRLLTALDPRTVVRSRP